MGETGDAVTYTLLAVGFAVLIFVAALFFVRASRRGNRRFRWGRARGADSQRDTAER